MSAPVVAGHRGLDCPEFMSIVVPSPLPLGLCRLDSLPVREAIHNFSHPTSLGMSGMTVDLPKWEFVLRSLSLLPFLLDHLDITTPPAILTALSRILIEKEL